MRASLLNKNFYKGKKVFLTGHTGFKGAWLSVILNRLGAEVVGYALKPEVGCLFEKIHGDELVTSITGDVCDAGQLRQAIHSFRPELVIHLAAQSTVPECLARPQYAYATNVMGTVNLLEAVRFCQSVKSVVVVTTDKVYENKGDGAVYSETDLLGGNDIYSASKVCVEYVVESYKQSFFQTESRLVGVATARASNVLAGGDHVRSRLIPAVLYSFASGETIQLRHPQQTRPWQSVLDALNGYLALGRLLYSKPQAYSSSWNIGPTRDGIRTVLWVVETMMKLYNQSPECTFRQMQASFVESETLGLDITKALSKLEWEPELSCEELLENVVAFFKDEQNGKNVREICFKQVEKFYGM